MTRILVIVPFVLDQGAIDNRRAQTRSVNFGPGIDFEFRGPKASPALLDSYHDSTLGDIALFEVGLSAQEEGFDAVCMDTISDTAMNALRSVLDIPVIGPGRASYLIALMLGTRFSILTQWDGWIPGYKKVLQEYGLMDRVASIRSINMMPDLSNLLGGKENVVFPKLVKAGEQCVADGADVIVLGSTTMHQAHGHLTENLPVPIVNPGPVSYKMAEAFLDLGLTHSRTAYPGPSVPKPELIHAMMDAAQKVNSSS
jgi:allantoin racemase